MVGRILACGIVVAVLAIANPLQAQTYQPGKLIIVIADSELRIGNQVIEKVQPGVVRNVAAVNGDWLWLTCENQKNWKISGKPGWLHKSFVIELDRQAIGKLTALIQASPRNAQLYMTRGGLLFSPTDVSRSLDDFLEALRLEPKNQDFIDNFDFLMEFTDEVDPVISVCSKLIALSPNEKIYYYHRAQNLVCKKEYDKAIADYDQALIIDPNHLASYGYRGKAYFKKKDYAAALNHFNELIRREPKDHHGYIERGQTWCALCEYDKAIADFDQALQLFSADSHAQWGRGEAWLMKSEYAKAFSDLDEDKKYAKAWRNERTLFLLAVTELLQRQPESANNFQATIDVWEWKGDFALHSAILGSIAARLNGDPARAEKFLSDAGKNLKEEWALAIVKCFAGEVQEAAMLEVATKQEKLTEVHCYLGLDALAKGQKATAETHFKWVEDHGDKSIVQYVIARDEHKRLRNNVQLPTQSDMLPSPSK